MQSLAVTRALRAILAILSLNSQILKDTRYEESNMTTRQQKRTADEAAKHIVADAMDSLDFSEENAKKQYQETNDFYKDSGGCKLEKAPTDPDVPPCDDCGKEFSGDLACGNCHLAFYCSKQCQRRDWKEGGHKHDCKGRKEECERVAQSVVDHMLDTSLKPFERVVGKDDELTRLDSTAAYQYAQKYGLDDAMRQLFMEDHEEVLKRFQSGLACSYTNWIMCTLWRGQRRDGNGTKSAVFNCIDAQRIKSYVLSHPNALDAWFDASLALFLVPFDTTVFCSGIHSAAHRVARDVMAAWIFVCTKKTSMKAILLGSTRKADNEASFRVKSLAKRIQTAMKAVTNLDERDRGGSVEGMLNQIAAMMSHWTKTFKIKVDFDRELGLRGPAKQIYMQLARPIAIGTIERQRTLTMTETQQYMRLYGK